ncbi:hypothetical protein HNY73_005170 [Argiope bruennichi]|uniref:Uncharacterized protein n=1 Tax=Argiope bruennichi TaxID=94029 RepID=A0A8T0FI85_ARGBR|nr:hypothetical protein HNY73_005170 [Argiope bruennichi]
MSEDDSDISYAETIISDQEEKIEQESVENSNVNSGEEEDDMVDIEIFFYGLEDPLPDFLLPHDLKNGFGWEDGSFCI